MSDVKGRAREALTGITEGQWEINQEGWAMISAGSDSVIHGYVDATCDDCGNDVTGDAFVACSYEDRALIAAAPSLISDLLSLVEEQEYEIERLRGLGR